MREIVRDILSFLRVGRSDRKAVEHTTPHALLSILLGEEDEEEDGSF